MEKVITVVLKKNKTKQNRLLSEVFHFYISMQQGKANASFSPCFVQVVQKVGVMAHDIS